MTKRITIFYFNFKILIILNKYKFHLNLHMNPLDEKIIWKNENFKGEEKK